MEVEDFSDQLFGRYRALRIYSVIASMSDKFTTAEVARLSDAAGPDCSKELRRLVDLGVLRTVDRRGAYERPASQFWIAMGMLAEYAEDERRVR